MNLINFERLAEVAIRREISNNLSDAKAFELNLSIFRTEVDDKCRGRTVTVWFEIVCINPDFWDLMPVTIIYRDNELKIGDITERTKTFLDVAIKRLQRRYTRQIVENK